MKGKNIRLLEASEIECRVGTISDKGLSLLLYKDARADMKILDETFGYMGWQRIHEVIGGNLYCAVQLWDEVREQWVTKMDVGPESYTEKEKGQASDSFKRACVSVGIGRELYTAPFIWIPAGKTNLQKKGDKTITYDKFRVQEIQYNEQREIVGLTIVNQEGAIVYNLKAYKKTQAKTEQMDPMYLELARTGVSLETVLERYGVSSIGEMTADTYQRAMNSLKKTKSA